MIAIVHSIYSQSLHAPALNAGLMDNDAERYCKLMVLTHLQLQQLSQQDNLKFKAFFCKHFTCTTNHHKITKIHLFFYYCYKSL